MLTDYVLTLTPKGILLFGFLLGFIGYFVRLFLSKRNALTAFTGTLISLVFAGFIFWDSHVSATDLGEVAFNLTMIISIFIFFIGSMVGLLGAVKASDHLNWNR